MKKPSPKKMAEWQERAAKKEAIVPYYFEVFPTKVQIVCGCCYYAFQRSLIPNLNEPTFVCPNEGCRSRNWVPITYNLRY